ncbi:helix-turn-helix domain-containing protein [Phycicoccus sp. 3266]|uniref:helix-turn-helix transcriptional regulator n=1 Tax=Phycicoccus sp. 3266 TaxID=2817751 RepID=UPI0028622821|nr:helix-turn-helix domain-containing protein [Phycicoccus sp. 3266]MDR6861926.1 excisionase family DNA binding protein [Phycicoccus sp. 3266]
MADKRLLTVAEAAAPDQLDCSTDTIYARVRSGEWPHTKHLNGRNIRFTQEQIDAIIRMGAVEPIVQQPRRRKAG